MEYKVHYEGYKIIDADCEEEAEESMLADLSPMTITRKRVMSVLRHRQQRM